MAERSAKFRYAATLGDTAKSRAGRVIRKKFEGRASRLTELGAGSNAFSGSISIIRASPETNTEGETSTR